METQIQSFELDICITDENLSEQVTKITLQIQPSLRQNDLAISNLTGGITNRLVACYSKQVGLNNSQTILFRLYGAHTEDFISRDDEIETMKLLKKHNLGPQFYCKFKNGIAYEFLPGQILDQKMINDARIFTKTAQTFAIFHLVGLSEPMTAADLLAKLDKKPFIFSKTKQLLNLLKSDYKSNMSHMTEAFFERIPSWAALKHEIEQLEAHLTAYTSAKRSLCVLSHNDLLLGNIIFNDSDESIKFIDLEYSDVNYQAYDVANHFNEFAGVDQPDFSLFPSGEYQRKWCRIYLEKFYEKLNDEKKAVLTDAIVEEFCVEVNKFTLASHLIWAIWALVQAQSSLLKFNFVSYANLRFEQYFTNKERLFSLA
jgi:ethanolamine kinase